MKVLIVDDDAIVVQSCLRILELEGIDVHVAGTVAMGEELLAAKPAPPFDLLVTDIMMPGQDGFEMIRRTKKIQPALPILMMTGYLTANTREKGHRLGADNSIAKPFTPEELVEAVLKTINRNKGEPQK